MKYYYITFESGILHGHITLPHKDTSDGFNVADAHRHISSIVGHPVIVQSWVEVNERRHEEFQKYMAQTYYPHAPDCPNNPDNQKPRFGVLQGGKPDLAPSNPAGELRPVPPPDDKK